jgi:hypothetical protein
MAYLLLRGSDQNKYGTLMKGFVSQYSLGNDQYPKTIQTATDVLSNHKFDATYSENKNRIREQQRKQALQETETVSNTTSFAQKDVICHICGKKGHVKPKCPDANKIPKADWYITKAVGAYQTRPGSGEEQQATASDDVSVMTEASTNSRSAAKRPGKKADGS